MQIRRATEEDIPGLDRLLAQVLEVHAKGRPDLFRSGTRKYTDDELRQIIRDDERPVFVASADDAKPGDLLGHAFCAFEQHLDSNNMTDVKTLYIDDLCVDEAARGQHVGTALYDHVVDFARKTGCYRVTLNVWSCNEPAMHFYEHLGLKPYHIGMEQIL